MEVYPSYRADLHQSILFILYRLKNWLLLLSSKYLSVCQKVLNRASCITYSYSTEGDQPTQLESRHHVHLTQ